MKNMWSMVLFATSVFGLLVVAWASIDGGSVSAQPPPGEVCSLFDNGCLSWQRSRHEDRSNCYGSECYLDHEYCCVPAR